MEVAEVVLVPRTAQARRDPRRIHGEAQVSWWRGEPDYWLRFWRSLPGLKRMVRPGGIFTSFPVRGLRPMPRLRGFTWNTPNPRSSIRSPFIMEAFIASRTASTATSALTLVMSAALDT